MKKNLNLLLLFSICIFSCTQKEDNFSKKYKKVDFPNQEFDKVEYYYFDDNIQEIVKNARKIPHQQKYSFIDNFGNFYNSYKPKFSYILTKEDIDFLQKSLLIYEKIPLTNSVEIDTLATSSYDCIEIYRDVLIWKDKKGKNIAAFEYCNTCGSYNFYPSIGLNNKLITNQEQNFGLLICKMAKLRGEDSDETYCKELFLTKENIANEK